jgi:hypothetical protein
MTTTEQTTIGYKLFKVRANGTLGPLFINARQVVPLNEWLPAEDHPTKGFAHRPGWHATLQPVAPHLSEHPKSGPRRVWMRVEMAGVTRYARPESQGGTWALASAIRVLGPVEGE